MNSNLQNSSLQAIARNYYNDRTEKNFNIYYEKYMIIAYNAAKAILRDEQMAYEVVNDLFTKLYNRNDENFQFDNNKSHIGYIWHSASNLAKIKWNHNRIKVNNLQNCNYRTESTELESIEKILVNEAENIKVELGFSRDEYFMFESVLNFYEGKRKLYETDSFMFVPLTEFTEIDKFMEDFGCKTSVEHRIRKALRLKKTMEIEFTDLVNYVIISIEKINRYVEILEANSLEEIQKIKSKSTRKKISKAIFENTKVSMIICESDFNQEEETSDTLEYLGYMNNSYETAIDSEVGDATDLLFNDNYLQYDINAQIDCLTGMIADNEDKENPGLLKRVLIDNHRYKMALDHIMHIIDMGRKDDEGNTINDVIFCRELILSVNAIPAISNAVKEISVDKISTQKQIEKCLDEYKDILNKYTQLKYAQEEFNFDSVGAIKSRSHRYRKYIKEEFNMKMIISEIQENKLHTVTGEVCYKHDKTDVVKIRCNYKHGVLEGVFRTYYKDGNKNIVAFCKGGKFDGDYREFHRNGKPKVVGEYKDGIKVGSWTTYREDGSKDELYAIATDGSKLYELYDRNGTMQDSGMIKHG